ncbi:SRPBCC family protein [Actinoplanes sp. G11-F43]|uniref:SRPBCC family protein n=1 Tax=Actinoplanes sp. G11-F43 TaxID=3424130 RepID=UPI003D34CBE1
MPVVRTEKSTETMTLTFVAEFDHPPGEVWQVWADPRRLQRWWGPPTWPATVDRFEFEPGGAVRYHMTGPDGTKAHGWWQITDVREPARLEFDDGFAGDDGEPVDPEDITHITVGLEPAGAGTRMTTVATFRSARQLERLVEMGMEEGMRLAMGQIDEVLAGR